MSRFHGIIFDLDGVLCLTDEYHYLAWQALADRIGVPFDRTVNERLRGVSRMESLDIILERAPHPYTDAEKAALATEKNEMYRGFLAGMTPDDLPAGVRETLATPPRTRLSARDRFLLQEHAPDPRAARDRHRV